MSKHSVSENGKIVRKVNKNSKRVSKEILSETKPLAKQQLSNIKQGKAPESEFIKNVFLFGLSKLFQFLSSNLINKSLVDNNILRKLETAFENCKHDDKKFIQWLKKHPTISAYVSYYATLFMMFIMINGIVGNTVSKEQNNQDNSDKNKTVKIDTVKNDTLDNVKTYDLTSSTFTEDFFTENESLIIIWLLEMETYRDTAKQHQGESRYTYGPGLTWVYTPNGKKGYIQNACIDDYKTMADNFSDKEVWEQVHRHMTYPDQGLCILQKKCKQYGITKLNTNQILGLVIASYQRPADINQIVQNIVDAKGDQQKEIDAFTTYSGKEIWKEGTLKRRWWAAACYCGYITSEEVLALKRDGFSKVNINSIMRNGQFEMDSNTILYAKEKTKESNKTTVREFITTHKLNIQYDDTKNKKTIQYADTTTNQSMQELTKALKAYNQQNYTEAITHYENSIKLDIDNVEAYSSIALSYKKLGDNYKAQQNLSKAKECYEKCCNYVNQGANRIRNNKALLEDHAQKAALYYNAGKARESLADIYLQQQDLQNVVRQYDLAAKNYQTSIDNANQVDYEEETHIDTYKTAKQRATQQKDKYQTQLDKQLKKTGNKQTFNKATSKVKAKKLAMTKPVIQNISKGLQKA